MDHVGKLRIGVIFGGRSGEHAVSLMSARSVLAALDPAKYDLVEIGITRRGTWLVSSDPIGSVVDALEAGDYENAGDLVNAAVLPDPSRPGLWRLPGVSDGGQLEHFADLDVIFPVLHGTFGEDGTLQGLLELADMAYVGPGVLAGALAMDKAVFKDVMRANGIPVLDWTLVQRGEIERDPEGVMMRCEAVAPYPLFTKPANLGSSVGITKCRSRADLVEGLMEAAQFDRRVLVERGISGREIEVSVLGNEEPLASVPGEVIPHGDFYTYESKYHDDLSQLNIPAQIPDAIVEQARAFSLAAYRAIDGAGLARVDFLLDRETDELYLNEINTIPGFTRISMYPKLWEASGLPYPALCDRLIEYALARKAQRDATSREYTRDPGHDG
ncbi:MAG TPA: D-alanine--D-alanine ligase family protein [Anaerolineales bacterium]|nr:D-alanine--D-alanine ligase family protein [Anaerolineales bacterium]